MTIAAEAKKIWMSRFSIVMKFVAFKFKTSIQFNFSGYEYFCCDNGKDKYDKKDNNC